MVDPKTLDELEAAAKAEIASVDDPTVTFYPAWEKGALKKQIEAGTSKPQAMLNLIADLREARREAAELRAKPDAHAAADLAALREIIATIEGCSEESEIHEMCDDAGGVGPVLCTLARLESMLEAAERIPADCWFPVEVRALGGEPPRLVLQPIAAAGQRLDVQRLRAFAEALFHRARVVQIFPMGAP
jgi:hypothetical protein